MARGKDFLFSIIVPVYNVEKYIERCLDSIVNAIDVDCEVIIINDGSTDNCDLIINQYLSSKIPLKFKNNFSYICKDNKGLADTKNVGISVAKGKYISVVDSDDRINEDFYDTARKYINQNYDVIIYDLYLDYENDKKKNCISRAIREDINGSFMEQLMMGAMVGSSCNKIIKKSLYKYLFPIGKQYEDVCVTPFILIDAKKVKYIPNPNYIYLQRAKSIVSSNTLDGAFYKICSNLSSVLASIDNYDKYKEIIHVFFIDRTIDMLDLSLKKSGNSFLKKLKEFYTSNYNVIKYICDNNLIDQKKNILTNRQLSILKIIYHSLYNQNFKKIRRILICRKFVNWLRNIFNAFKKLVKVIFGGTYE